MLICPSFFDGRFDGIGRVSGAFFEAMTRINGRPPYVFSANDEVGACPPGAGRCFGRRHGRALVSALTLRPPVRPRVIVCTHLGLSPVARVLATRWGRPYVVFIHGVEAWKQLPRRSRWGIAGAERLFFNSQFTRVAFLRFNPWAAHLPGVVIPLGLTLSEGSARGGEDGTGSLSVSIAGRDGSTKRNGGFRILIVGRLAKGELCEGSRNATDLYKGFKPLILAVGLLAREVPGVRLWIVGDGDARPELEQWLSSRSERGLVDFLGRTSDDKLHQLYEEADVFALPSEAEGFGLVFAEAMAHGLPCVCVQAGAAPEVVNDGETGLVARPRDVADLADKLWVLAQNPALRKRLGATARKSYLSNFTAAAFEERIITALSAVPSRTSTGSPAKPSEKPCAA